MFAIAFDLHSDILREVYHNRSWRNAWKDVRRFLWRRGFTWQQGTVLFGDRSVNKRSAERAVEDLSAAFPWFSAAVKDIRLLKIDYDNDLAPAVARGRMLRLSAEAAA